MTKPEADSRRDTRNAMSGADRLAGRKSPRVRCYTGEHLLDKIPVVEAMLSNGESVLKTSKVLRMSRNSVTAIKQRLLTEGCASPEQAAQLKRGIQDKYAALTHKCLDAVNDGKLKKAGLYELVKTSSICAEKSGLIESPSSSMLMLIQQNYGLQPSHSASQATIDVSPSNGHGQPSDSPEK